MVHSIWREDSALPQFRSELWPDRLYFDARDDAHNRSWRREMAFKGGKMSRMSMTRSLLPAKVFSTRGSAIFVLSLALLFLASPKAIPSEKKIPPHTLRELAQTWIGISEDESCSFRLSLHEDGKGSGAYVYLDGEPHVFEIKAWNFDLKKHIELSVPPEPHTDLESGRMQGTVIGFRMELTLSGKGWEERISLRPEAPLKEKWDKLVSAMSGGLKSRSL